MNESKKKLLVIVGPTAVGKSELAFKAARILGTEIISADSRQFYRETEKGTAKPEPHMLKEVKHHFINSLSIKEEYTAGQFERDALAALTEIFQNRDWAVMAGGSGLYVKAVCSGFDEMPEVKAEVRERWNAKVTQEGLEAVRRFVAENDPEFYRSADVNNPVRLIRAAEVIESSDQPFSAFRNKATRFPRPFSSIKIGLTDDRTVLYERIDRRMEQMIADGLFEEAEMLFPHRALQALQTVGYQEIFGHLEGKYDKQEAVRLLKRNSRRYAKRQLTWFRRDPEIRWFMRAEEEKVLDYIRQLQEGSAG